MSAIKHVILDFDGTCTQIPVIYQSFLNQYLKELNMPKISHQEWQNAQDLVRQHSPTAGWTLGTTSSAPAAADPYILSGEATKYLVKTNIIKTPVPSTAFTNAYADNPGPWRKETLDVIKTLLKHEVAVHFVSNSSPQLITQRLQDLWGGTPLPASVNVHGNASKFNISEPDWVDIDSWPAWIRDLYNAVPAAETSVNIGRPIYLRRGSFISIIADLFKHEPENMLASTVFCGDVWELDLALPSELGANIHLIERASPFDTYPYERELTKAKKGKISADLNGLKEWL
jgi:phosphoglycolate phosphatase-like HAD superfamily hydrolase